MTSAKAHMSRRIEVFIVGQDDRFAPLEGQGQVRSAPRISFRLANFKKIGYEQSPQYALSASREAMQDWNNMEASRTATIARIRCMAAILLGAAIGWSTGCRAIKGGGEERDRAAKAEKQSAASLPNKESLRVSQFVFIADFKLREDQPLFRELAELREQVYKDLQLLPSNTVIQVYLFDDKDGYKLFMHDRYPDLPVRRAFFVAQPRSIGGEDLQVFTYWGDQIQQDLRHELTHAMLHSVLKDVPIWLDEGLAEYYELPPHRKGVNAAHVTKLRNGGELPVRPNLARLEQLEKVEQMHPDEYQEAWAWVHLMQHSTPEAKAALLHYLQLLRTNAKPGPLLPALAAVFESPEDSLQTHLAELEKGIAKSTARTQR